MNLPSDPQLTGAPTVKVVLLENDALQAVVSPARGGRITSFVHRTTGREFLLGSTTARPEPSEYGEAFERQLPAGFDECFPTVASSFIRVAGGDETIVLPDHGELWARPWQYEHHGDALILWIDGVQLPYRFEKRLHLQGRRLRIDYHLANRGASSFPYVWSAHPLLNVSGGERIRLPPEVREVVLAWASNPSLGRAGQVLPWGAARNDLSTVQPAERRTALKCFTGALSVGEAAICFDDTGESLHLHFNVEKTPYLGIWLCYSGWPVGDSRHHHTIALEPTTSPTDRLHEAVADDTAPVLNAGASITWTLELSVEYTYGST